jgi:2-hydroxymuconate-semialdehyde hydrolase
MPRADAAVERWLHELTPITVNGFRTMVLDHGFGDPVVFLHGIPTQAYIWRDVARIVGESYRAIAPDLLGFGFADKPASADLSPRGQADFIESLLAELGIGDFTLVAHDYGALVAAEIVARQPGRVQAVVLCNTSFWMRDWMGSALSPLRLLRLPGVGELAFRLARPFMLRRAFAIYVEDDARLTDRTMRVYWWPFAHGFADILLRLSRRDRFSRDDLRRWRHALHDYDGLALVVWGELDPTFHVSRGRSIAQFIPNGRYHGLPQANHFVQEDAPEELGQLIVEFLGG